MFNVGAVISKKKVLDKMFEKLIRTVVPLDVSQIQIGSFASFSADSGPRASEVTSSACVWNDPVIPGLFEFFI